jgi:multicomponent Na+:H+ antiporter subunit F
MILYDIGDIGLVGATATVMLNVLIVALFLTFIRLVRGPSLPDRVVALDLCGTVVVGIIAVYAILTEQRALLDVAIGLALVAFLGTVAFARYVEKGGVR